MINTSIFVLSRSIHGIVKYCNQSHHISVIGQVVLAQCFVVQSNGFSYYKALR